MTVLFLLVFRRFPGRPASGGGAGGRGVALGVRGNGVQGAAPARLSVCSVGRGSGSQGRARICFQTESGCVFFLSCDLTSHCAEIGKMAFPEMPGGGAIPACLSRSARSTPPSPPLLAQCCSRSAVGRQNSALPGSTASPSLPKTQALQGSASSQKEYSPGAGLPYKQARRSREACATGWAALLVQVSIA